MEKKSKREEKRARSSEELEWLPSAEQIAWDGKNGRTLSRTWDARKIMAMKSKIGKW